MAAMKRREFLKTSAAGVAALALGNVPIISGQTSTRNLVDLRDRLYSMEHPFGYDSRNFDSAQRIHFGSDGTPSLSILPRPGKNLRVKLYVSDTEQGIHSKLPKDLNVRHNDMKSQNISIKYSDYPKLFDSPELFYKIEYFDDRYGWKSTPVCKVKTPNVDLENGGKIKVILWGDPHTYSDVKYEPEDSEFKKEFLRGDYITTMLKKIIADSSYEPGFLRKPKKIVEGFTYAWTLKYILESRPDLVIGLGDEVGSDSYWVWGKDGQWPDHLQPEEAYERRCKVLGERTRRTLAAISPEIPYYLVIGNHEGENGWEPTKDYARAERERLLNLPKFKEMYFTPVRISSKPGDRKFYIPEKFPEFNGNHYVINWANGDVQFYALDPFTYVTKHPEKITDWTLGEKQKDILAYHLGNSIDTPYKFLLMHHLLGGYPLGPHKNKGAYGRGPLFTIGDYDEALQIAMAKGHDLFNPEDVEQVWLTELAKATNVRGQFYGHDHIFFVKELEESTYQNKKMFGGCVGSTKFTGGDVPRKMWEGNPYWERFYGYHTDNPSPFKTPPGVLEMEIDKYGITMKYVCTAPTDCMDYNNMPYTIIPGGVVPGTEYRINR